MQKVGISFVMTYDSIAEKVFWFFCTPSQSLTHHKADHGIGSLAHD